MIERDTQIDAAIAHYYRQLESGTIPDRNTFLDSHSEIRGELTAFLENKTIFDRLAGTKSQLDDAPTVAPATPTDDALGSLRYFGDYELLDEIARGGMGVVFRARQVSLNRIVALKMILAGQFARPEDVQRFRAEAEAAAALDHPNILPVYEVGALQGQQYFAMKLVEGGTFAGVRSQESGDKSQLSGTNLKARVTILIQVARAVHFAHQRGIIHRDLKPGNILLSRRQADSSAATSPTSESGLPTPDSCSLTPYVTDFGLAKKVESDFGLTQTGAIVGTPNYMAPEQARADQQLTTAVDVYSLGAILYEVLTGRPPFRAPTVMETVLHVLEREPVHPTTVIPQADRDLSVVALKCLEKDPARRYQSAAELADELERWTRNEPIMARKTGPIRRLQKWTKRRPAIAGLLCGLIATLVGGSIGLWASFAQTRRTLHESERQLYVSRVTLASREVAVGQFDRAVPLLMSAPKEWRGWEWRFLWNACHQEVWSVNPGLQSLFEIAASADGRLIAVSGSETESDAGKLLDGESGKYIRSLKKPPTMKYCLFHLVMDRQGSLLAGNDGQNVFVWNSDGQVIRTIEMTYSSEMAINPDGTLLAISTSEGRVQIWDMRDGKQKVEINIHEVGSANTIAFDKSGQALIITFGHHLYVFDANSGREKFNVTVEVPMPDPHRDALAGAFSEKGDEFLVASPGAISVFASGSWELKRVFKNQSALRTFGKACPDQLVISRDGRYATTRWNKQNAMAVWDLLSEEPPVPIRGHTEGITGVVIGPGDTSVISVSFDQTIRKWTIPPLGNPRVLLTKQHDAESVAYSPNEDLLAVGDAGGEISVHSRKNRHATRVIGSLGSRASSLAFSSDGVWLIASTAAFPEKESPREFSFAHLKVWDVRSGEQMAVIRANDPNQLGFSFDVHGELTAIADATPTIYVYSLPKLELRQRLDIPESMSTSKLPHYFKTLSVAFDPSGSQLAAPIFWGDKMAVVFSLASDQQLVRTLPAKYSGRIFPYLIAYDPFGKIIACATESAVHLIRVDTGQIVGELSARRARRLIFDQSGERLLVIGERADLWDTATEEPILTFPYENCRNGAFSSDGNRLALAVGRQVLEFDAGPKPVPIDPNPKNKGSNSFIRWIGLVVFSIWLIQLIVVYFLNLRKLRHGH